MKVPLDKVVEKVVALGVPGLVLVGVVSFVGAAGGAAITTALALLGGPFGMLGGFAVLGLLTLISGALAEFGLEKIFTQVLKGLKERGESRESILEKIDSYKISKSLKLKLKDCVEKWWEE